MRQFMHALQLLGYRMRRYPLWIAVLIAAFPLWMATRWIIQEHPWTSSRDLWTSFVRLSDQRFLKHTKYQRGRVSRFSESQAYSDNYLIDLRQKTVQRLPFDKFHSLSNPKALINGSIVFSDDRETLWIVDSITLEATQITDVPLSYDSLVNGRYAIYWDGNSLESFDLVERKSARGPNLLFPGRVRAVDGSSHAVVETTTWEALDSFLATLYLIWSEIDLGDMEGTAGMEEPMLAYSLYDIIPNSWQLVSLYAIDERGPHWVKSWIASTLNDSITTTTQGLIESRRFDHKQTEIREANSGKIIATHPAQIQNDSGMTFFCYGLHEGGLEYRSAAGRMWIDARQPGIVLASNSTGFSNQFSFDPKRLFYCRPKDEDPYLAENAPGTLEFCRRDTTALISSWKGENWFGISQFLWFMESTENVLVTDDEQTIYQVDTSTGEVIDRFDLYSDWHLPLICVAICVCLWGCAYALTCSQLRIPYLIAVTAPLWLLWMLVSIRLESVGHPDFIERLSNQALAALLCFALIVLPLRVWPESVARLSAYLVIGYIFMCGSILIYKLGKGVYAPIETHILVLLVTCAVLEAGLILSLLMKLRRVANDRRAWQLSLTPILFWTAVCSMFIAVFTYTFKTSNSTNLAAWLGLARLFFYPTLGLGLWQIVKWKNKRLWLKMATCILWMTLLITIFTCLKVSRTPAPYFPLEFREVLLASSATAAPTAIVFLAFSLQFPRRLRFWCKTRLGVSTIRTLPCTRTTTP